MNARRLGSIVSGKYALKRLVGTGSMGEVYEGTHLEIGKRVAVKLMNASYADAPEIVARFRREARAASAVESDYIVQVFDAGRDAEHGLYMVSEFLVGEDLEALLARQGRLDPLFAARMAYQVARGLARAHAAGVIHRDLKPANIFVTTRDDESLLCKILDFGISKVTLDDLARGDAGLTAAGLTLGTPQYMSPEQVKAQPDVDGRADVWSLGAVLYEALAGVPAYAERASTFDILTAIVKEEPPKLVQIAPWVPREIAEVVEAAMVKDREKRLPDAQSFARRLLDALPEGSVSVSGPSIPRISVHAPVAEDIPVSIAPPADDADDPEEPITARDPTTDPTPSATDDDPPPSVADRVEVFRRLPR